MSKDRLVKIWNMTYSSNDFEAIVALRNFQKLCKQMDLDFVSLFKDEKRSSIKGNDEEAEQAILDHLRRKVAFGTFQEKMIAKLLLSLHMESGMTPEFLRQVKAFLKI